MATISEDFNSLTIYYEIGLPNKAFLLSGGKIIVVWFESFHREAAFGWGLPL